MLNLINVHLSKSLNNADFNKNKCLFDELCNADKVNVTVTFKSLIAEIYGVNVATESLQRGMANTLCIKYINYDRISANLDNNVVRTRLNNIVYENKLQTEIVVREIEMVAELISINLRKYLLILNNAHKMSIYELDQACCDLDKNTGDIRKIITEIPSIIDKTYKSCNKANMTYLLNNIAIKPLYEEFIYLFNLKRAPLKMFESELQYICDIDKSMNEKLRGHHAIDSEIEREIIALKRRRKDEKKKDYQK